MVTKVADTVANYGQEGQFRRLQPSGLGDLDFRIAGGNVTDNKNWFTIADTTLALPDDSISNIVIEYDIGTITITPTGFNTVPLYTVTTVSGAITTIVDKRTASISRTLITTVGVANPFPLTPYNAFSIEKNVLAWLPLSDTDSSGPLKTLAPVRAFGSLAGDLAGYTMNMDGPPGIGMKAIGINYGDQTSYESCSIMLPRFWLENQDTKMNEFGTMGIWIYIDESSISSTIPIMAGAGDTGQDEVWFIEINTSGDVRNRVRSSTGGDVIVTTDTPISVQTWHHIMIKMPNTTGPVDIKVDGVESTITGSGSESDHWWNDMLNSHRAVWSVGGDYGWNTSAGDFRAGRKGTRPEHKMRFSNIQFWSELNISNADISTLYDLGFGV